MVSTPAIRLIGTLGACLLAACTATPVPTPTPSPDATPTPASQPSPTQPPTGSPAATSSPAPVVGRDWTAIALPLDAEDNTRWASWASDVTAGGPGFVAVGGAFDSGNIWASADGISWEQVSRGLEWDRVSVNRVVDWDGLLVAAGGDGGHAAFWTSRDGRDWQRVSDSPTFDFYAGPRHPGFWKSGAVMGLYVEDAELVAQGRLGCDCGAGAVPLSNYPPLVTWRTADAVTWTRAQGEVGGEPVPPVPPVAGGDGWLRVFGEWVGGVDAGSWFPSIQTSADGSAWRTVYLGPEGFDLSDLQPFDGGWVAVGGDGLHALVVTSPDGLTWTRSSDLADAPDYAPDLDNGSMYALAVAGDRLVAVGDHFHRPAAFVSPPGAAAVPGGGLRVGWAGRPVVLRSEEARNGRP